jgi:hypothetical protein
LIAEQPVSTTESEYFGVIETVVVTVSAARLALQTVVVTVSAARLALQTVVVTVSAARLALQTLHFAHTRYIDPFRTALKMDIYCCDIQNLPIRLSNGNIFYSL